MTKRSGQITLLVLLLGLLGLTVGLSAISRSLQDIRQSTQTDSGTKALAGAEAGLEYGITQINPGQSYLNCSGGGPFPVPGSINFPGFSQDVIYQICAETKPFAEYRGLGLNDVMTVDLQAGLPGTSKNIGVLWQSDGTAVLMSALYQKVVNSGPGPEYKLDRFAVNSIFAAPSNNFSPGYDVSNVCLTNNSNCTTNIGNYVNCTTRATDIDQSANTVPNRIAPSKALSDGTYNIKLLRVRRLYALGDVVVCAFDNPSGGVPNAVNMGANYITVTATATTIDGTTRRVKATRVASSLPGLFDYAIFTEGALSK